MARTNAVWGIDIGQCALKALRCRAHDDPDKIVVEAFDYIEYSKILTQPDANPAELVADALKQFLSRNSVKGDRVAISVSGQSGLARFIKLPPVEAKKIPDIVRYEARQQIPFDLNDVIWDYQRMGGGSEEEGFILETEIGLFAMKRDAVFRALEPFQQAGIEVDVVQLTPLALYNYVLFDQLQDLPPPDEYDPENPPESVVVISVGTDATDLVVTNGYRVWQRSVPLGGSHFTKALTKDLKLTFAKAEHLKRNAATAQDPKALFQAMKLIFNDLQTELQRSLGYFTNLDRAAKIGRVVALGNAFKLPGLRRYLSQSLGYEIGRIDAFRGMVGPEVLATPAFKENLLSFGVCYGLALQGLGRGGLKTNLLPKEITQDRLIREKKPWAVAAAALILLGCSVSFASYSLQLSTTNKENWAASEASADQIFARSNKLKTDAEKATKEFHDTENIGKHLVSNVEGRTRWLALLQAIDTCLPKDDPAAPAKDVSDREQVHITNIDCQQVEDAAKWFGVVKQWYKAQAAAAAATPGTPPAAGAPAEEPAGPGVVVQLVGYHYHYQTAMQGAEYVRSSLLKNLAGPVMKDVGASFPVLIDPQKITIEEIVTPAAARKDAGGEIPAGASVAAVAAAAARGGASPEDKLRLHRFDFRIQFVWQPASAAKDAAPGPAKP